VDDDETSARLLRVMLNGEGYQVRTFQKPLEALAEIQKEPPDVLIADWVMPEMNGPDLLQRVRKLPDLQSTYCILITAYDLKWKKVTGLLLGADDYLTKPISETELLARIRVGVRVRRLERTAGLLSMAAALGQELRGPLDAAVKGIDKARAQAGRGDPAALLRALEEAKAGAQGLRDVLDGLVHLGDLRERARTAGNMVFDVDLPGADRPPA